jgi:hypothetical protein
MAFFIHKHFPFFVPILLNKIILIESRFHNQFVKKITKIISPISPLTNIFCVVFLMKGTLGLADDYIGIWNCTSLPREMLEMLYHFWPIGGGRRLLAQWHFSLSAIHVSCTMAYDGYGEWHSGLCRQRLDPAATFDVACCWWGLYLGI